MVFAVICVGFLITSSPRRSRRGRTTARSILTGTTWDPIDRPVRRAAPHRGHASRRPLIALLLAVPHRHRHRPRDRPSCSTHGSARLFSSLVELLAAVPSVVYGFGGSSSWARGSSELRAVARKLFGGHFPLPGSLPRLVDPARRLRAVRDGATHSSWRSPATPSRRSRTSSVEGALSVGATTWQMLRKVVLPARKSASSGRSRSATARALGETIAVALVIGLNPNFAKSLNAPAATLAVHHRDGVPGLDAHRRSPHSARSRVILMAMTLVVNLRRPPDDQPVRGQSDGAVTAPAARRAPRRPHLRASRARDGDRGPVAPAPDGVLAGR